MPLAGDAYGSTGPPGVGVVLYLSLYFGFELEASPPSLLFPLFSFLCFHIPMAFMRLLLAALCAQARGSVLFGYYDDNLTATPYATVHQANSLAEANATHAAFGIPSLLSVYGAVFQGAPQRTILQR